jgi:hypothetical protein
VKVFFSVLGRKELLFLYDTDRIENDASNSSSIVACVFLAAVTFLPSRCIATIGGVHIQTHRLMGGIYEVCLSDGLRCRDLHTSFIKIGSGI